MWVKKKKRNLAGVIGDHPPVSFLRTLTSTLKLYYHIPKTSSKNSNSPEPFVSPLGLQDMFCPRPSPHTCRNINTLKTHFRKSARSLSMSSFESLLLSCR